MTDKPLLTERQTAIIGGLEAHLSLKEIAHLQGISIPTLNREISHLKTVFGARNRREILVEYNRLTGRERDSFSIEPICSLQSLNRPEAISASNEAGLLHFADAGAFMGQAWAPVYEPTIVPRWLDGDHFVLARLGAIFGIFFLILAVPVLGVAMLKLIAEILQGGP